MHFGFRLARASLGRSLERRRSWKGSGCTSQRLLDSPLERRPWQTLSLSLSLSPVCLSGFLHDVKRAHHCCFFSVFNESLGPTLVLLRSRATCIALTKVMSWVFPGRNSLKVLRWDLLCEMASS